MKLRFRVGSKQARKNGDIEALADAMRALKNNTCGSYMMKYGMLLFNYHGEGYVKFAL